MWINEQTLGTFVLHTDIRYECWKQEIELPAILTDEVLAQNGYAVVNQIYADFDEITQKLQPKAPVKTDSGWVVEYEAVGLDPTIIENNRAYEEVKRKLKIIDQLNAGDVKVIRYMLANDTAKIEEWKLKAAELRSQL
jgi:hypothetical protein